MQDVRLHSMIEPRRKLTVLKLVINLKISEIRAIWRRTLATLIVALVVTLAYQCGFSMDLTILAHIVRGTVFGVMLFFRPIRLWHFVLVWCFALPFQIVPELQWWTVPVVGAVSSVLLTIETITLKIENLFRRDTSHL